MTNPMGRAFISYRRSPARSNGNDEAALVRNALKDAGVPTWRDLDDLDNEPTEEALIQAINDPNMAGAILLISPEVELSPIIRQVEALRIFRRHSQHDGFWVLPVLIGIDYADAEKILGSPAGFQELNQWNMHKVDKDTLTVFDAREIARLALKARIGAIRQVDSEGATSIGVFVRRPPENFLGLTHDFSSRFNGRETEAATYQVIQDALLHGASCSLVSNPNKAVVGQGVAPLPLGVLVGAVYSPRAEFRLEWIQPVEGHEHQHWSLDFQEMDFSVDFRVAFGEPTSKDLVVAIGVSANIEHAVNDYLTQQKLNSRARLHCAPRSGSYLPGQVLEVGEGVTFIHKTVQKVRKVQEDLGMSSANVHLFLACPLAMAVLFGQKLNTFSHCHLYEHNPANDPPYTKVHTFQPSSLEYS